jgi:hypothetical protein
MTRIRFLILLFTALMLTAAILRAQEDCPTFVQTTIVTVNEVCNELGRDEACYGNENLEAVGRADDFSFSAPGDVTDVANIESLRLASMQLEEQVWGVVMMELQANIATDTSQNAAQRVTLVLFGDVSIINQVPPLVELSAIAQADTQVYIRPNTSDTAIASLDAGTSVIANGRLDNSTWIRIALADGYGWVSADALQITGDVSTLAAADAQGEVFGPMQAFIMQTGDNERPCAQAPDDGVLIQTPQGVGEINFLINEVDVRLGSTGFFSTDQQALNVAILEGQGEITSEGETEIVEEGHYSTVPLDEEGLADGEPSDAEEYDDEAFDELPVDWLPEEVESIEEDDEAADETFDEDSADETPDDDEIVPTDAPDDTHEEPVEPAEEPDDTGGETEP